MDERRPLAAILGTRFTDFGVEREILGDVDIVAGAGADRQELLDVAAGADVILAGAAPRFDADTIAGLSCRGIVRLGVGVDSVDLDAARSHGLAVSYVPDYGTEAVALHAVTLALAALRRLPMADRSLRAGTWGFADLRPLHLPSALTVGVVGYGRIGRRTAEMLAGVGFADFLICDPLATNADVPSGRLAPLEEVLAGSDLVTLHAPGGDTPLIGKAELATMRDGSILVNTARGSLVDVDALVEALAAGRPAVAALDVFPREPADATVFEPVADRVVLTPHMSWYTEETELELRRQGAAEAKRLLTGEPPLHPVVAPKETP